ncbi:hypothetical protein Dsin_017433 [Dipteronia sinensis]|uniref:Transmembrane protein n=1 Tax=Dipteronia sinensis TaxID=43782 RepID=A0AAE0AG87_9ROSI|nr:hypothetical protein Dsin_017433 [Dipteronia sinensis]
MHGELANHQTSSKRHHPPLCQKQHHPPLRHFLRLTNQLAYCVVSSFFMWPGVAVVAASCCFLVALVLVPLHGVCSVLLRLIVSVCLFCLFLRFVSLGPVLPFVSLFLVPW